MPRKIVIWQCSFCCDDHWNEKFMINHELRCFQNPANKACMTCAFMKRRLRVNKERLLYKGFVFQCLKKGILMYTLPDKAGEQRKINVDMKTMKVLAEQAKPGGDSKLVFPTSGCKKHSPRIPNK